MAWSASSTVAASPPSGESLNAVEAWLGSLPGNPYANVRQPIVHTLNLIHLMPVSAVWAGPEANHHLRAPPLMLTQTRGSTPFRLDLFVDDVGHTLIVGPTGSGKSVLLATLALQFRRFIGAQVVLFDKGRSARAAALAMDGTALDLALDGDLAFQPLKDIDKPGALAFALDWVLGLLANEKVAVTPDVKDAIWTALQSLASAPASERTLTGLAVLVQSNKLSQALHPYTLEGPYGRLLDGAADTLALGDVMHFEMDGLMQVKPLVLPVLTYLFHRLEARFDGRPTLLVLDEAWVFLDDPLFAARIREWLKTLRKKNVAVVFATQSLADIERSSIAPALLESCPTRIFLPNDRAIEPQAATVYERFGLNPAPDRDHRPCHAQTRLLRADGPRQSPVRARPRCRRLGLRRRRIARRPAPDRPVRGSVGPAAFAIAFLRAKGLAWAAELLESLQTARIRTLQRRHRRCLTAARPAARSVIKPAAALLNSTAVGAVLAAQPASAVSERLSPFRIPPAKPKRTTS